MAKDMWENWEIQKRFDCTLPELIALLEANEFTKYSGVIYYNWKDEKRFIMYNLLKHLGLKPRTDLRGMNADEQKVILKEMGIENFRKARELGIQT